MCLWNQTIPIICLWNENSYKSVGTTTRLVADLYALKTKKRQNMICSQNRENIM